MANARGSSRNAYGSAARRFGASSGTAKKRPVAKTSAPRGRRHRLLGVLSVIFAALALACSVLRMLPEDLQALPYIPVIVSATPWFVILAVLALILSVISRRWIAMLMALACIGLQVWWQWPFFSASTKLPAAVDAAMASTRADTGDMIARVMTFNVYKGHADAKAIVDIESVSGDVVAVGAVLDAVGADFILIEALPGGPGWRAVADRLGRAAVGSGGAEA